MYLRHRSLMSIPVKWLLALARARTEYPDAKTFAFSPDGTSLPLDTYMALSPALRVRALAPTEESTTYSSTYTDGDSGSSFLAPTQTSCDASSSQESMLSSPFPRRSLGRAPQLTGPQGPIASPVGFTLPLGVTPIDLSSWVSSRSQPDHGANRRALGAPPSSAGRDPPKRVPSPPHKVPAATLHFTQASQPRTSDTPRLISPSRPTQRSRSASVPRLTCGPSQDPVEDA